MKISIKGVVLSTFVSFAVVVFGILPIVVIFPHSLRSSPVLFYALFVGIVAALFQGFLLARIAGNDKFSGSALVCAGLFGLLSLSPGVFYGIGAFFVGLLLLYLGKIFDKKNR